MEEKTIKGIVTGVIIGAIAATGLTIGTGVAILKGQAEKMSETAVQEALVDEFSDICVAQYEAAPDRATHEAALKTLAVYEQRAYVARQGWGTMPGDDKPYRDSADECAAKIAAKF